MKIQPKNEKLPAKFRTLVLLTLMPFVVWGCSGISPARIAPKPSSSAMKLGGTVRVADVTGGKKSTFGGAEMINNDQFKKALILALQQSGLFDEVSADHGDLDLNATIRSEDQKTSRGLQYTATMVVSYKFVDHAGKTAWSGSYDSEFSSVAFSGAARTVEAREGSARENLASLINGIRECDPPV